MTSVGIGDRAPDFSLPGTDGTDEGRRTYALHEFGGRAVVLAFYPADSSPVCTAQLGAYSDELDRFAALDAQVLAISPQSVGEHEHFSEANGGFGFPLLADEAKAVGDVYGVLGPLGFYKRSVFVIDRGGVVRYAHRATAGLTFRPVDELVEVLERVDP
ncbi:MAG: peroxiredoxin [Acidimicrobiales bacterium]|nr:peroxiredoxin [Acidimicrobiales bacterium]